MNDEIPDRDDLVLLLASGDIDECAVSLWVIGEDLNPVWISEFLGVEATESFRKGDFYGVSSRHRRKTGAWRRKISGTAPVTLQDLLAELFESLPSRPEVWTHLRSEYLIGVSFFLSLRAFNRGFEISSSLVSRLAEIGADLDFDIYAEGLDP